ncbi:MAG: DNA internalization-related competence protein ComEC/Rec2, partial [Pusillimonas sp.]
FYGAHWAVDGVSFEFLWPVPVAGVLPGSVAPKLSSKQRNKGACVLRVSGAHHSILLTGDIGVAEERQLVRRGLVAVDVVVAPHHGSRFSSSSVFAGATRPAHVISQNGWLNRYGHPAPAVQQRWEDHGAQFWRTDWHGAVTLASMPDGLQVQAERKTRPRYWQRPDPGGKASVVP